LAVILGLLSVNAIASSETGIGKGPLPGLAGSAAAANNAQTTYTNPAGMSRLEGTQKMFQFVYAHGEHDSSTEITGLNIKTEGFDTSDIFAPTGYYVRPLNERWKIGFSVIAPAGFGDDYGSSDARRYIAKEWDLFYLALNSSISYRVSDKLSLGATVVLNYSAYDLESDVLNLETPGTNDGKMELEADGISASFNLGMLYEFSDQTRVGVVYRSEVESELEGDPDFSGLDTTTLDLVSQLGLENLDVEIEGTLPAVLQAGLYHRFDNQSAFTVDIALVDFSEFVLTEFNVFAGTILNRQPKYDDILAGSIGYSFPLGSKYTIGTSRGYLESPVDKDERSFLFRIDEAMLFGLGVSWETSNSHGITINFDYIKVEDGRIETPTLPIVDRLISDHDNHDVLIVDFMYRW